VELKRHAKSGSIFGSMSFRARKRRRTGAARQGDGGSREAAGAAIVTGVDPKGNVKRNGPLAQALAYAVGHALPGRAALGLGLSKAVPLAVLAGKCSTKKTTATATITPASTALRYVHGNVVTPDTCGGCYSFNVDAFGAFDGKSTGRHALAAYLDVVLSGLKAGRAWLAKQKKNGSSLLAPTPMCGRRLMFGAEELSSTPSLLFRPLRDKDTPSEHGRGINASQGEIFSAAVDLTQLQAAVPDGTYVSWCRESNAAVRAELADSSQPTKSSQDCETSQPIDKSQSTDGPQKVLVKVISRACFGLLVGVEGILWKHDFGHLRQYLSPSLHGVCTIYENGEKRGLVQIMPDLTSDQFEPLRPAAFESSREKWKGLWTAFTVLVQGTLIPLAEADVIHPDLRPGHNRTANLMYSPTFGEIRIIDLDSLVLFPDWVCSDLDDRYLTKTPHPALPEIQTALEFLFYQVIVITDTWLHRIKEDDVNATTIVFNNTMIEDWTRLDPAGLCDRAFIVTRLGDIGAKFGFPANPDA
jgi:hypothetical protein